MTKPVTVNLPDDVASRIEAEPDADAYVTEAVRRQIARDNAREKLADADRRWTPERRQELRERLGRTGRRVA
jgi:Arc/MetJ-type ribon-helix-helix transcriptional regulator